ncbi:hypothetical protein G6F67_009719 [Rhizopus microsporus]|nr:hypothetical protein G6F67_009719 [Rhizopus microsporus]
MGIDLCCGKIFMPKILLDLQDRHASGEHDARGRMAEHMRTTPLQLSCQPSRLQVPGYLLVHKRSGETSSSP